MENKISLSNLIINKIKEQGRAEKKQYIEDKDLNLYSYFLKEDIQEIIGEDTVEEADLDILTSKNALSLQTIYNDEPLKIYYTYSQTGFQIKGYMDNVEVFSISNIKSSYCNEIYTSTGTKHYSISSDEENYTYTENSNDEKIFQGRLTPLNAKYGEYEIFEYTRDVPEEKVSDSLLLRIIDRFKSDGYVQVKASRDLIDRIDFIDEIFETLKAKAEIIKTKNKGKQLKKED